MYVHAWPAEMLALSHREPHAEERNVWLHSAGDDGSSRFGAHHRHVLDGC